MGERSDASLDLATGWRYPRTQPSLPESNASVRVPRTGPFWRAGAKAEAGGGKQEGTRLRVTLSAAKGPQPN